MAEHDSTTLLKRCSKCRQEFPATPEHFMPHKGKLYCQCHDCRRASKNASHERNREHNNARTRRWYDEHPGYRKNRYHDVEKHDPAWVQANQERSRQWVEQNRERNRAKAREWGYRNADRKRALRQRYYEHNKAILTAKNREYRRANRERHNQRNREWDQRNPEKAKAKAARRRAMERNAPGHFTADDVRRQLASQNGECWWCHKPVEKYHVDHLIPLARGGTNEASNIVIACPRCNSSRGARLPDEWANRPNT